MLSIIILANTFFTQIVFVFVAAASSSSLPQDHITDYGVCTVFFMDSVTDKHFLSNTHMAPYYIWSKYIIGSLIFCVKSTCQGKQV